MASTTDVASLCVNVHNMFWKDLAWRWPEPDSDIRWIPVQYDFVTWIVLVQVPHA